MLQSTSLPINSSLHWFQLYQSAILELDYAKLPQRISEARHAIYDRAETVLTASTEEERRKLSDALRALSVLEKIVAKEKIAA